MGGGAAGDSASAGAGASRSGGLSDPIRPDNLSDLRVEVLVLCDAVFVFRMLVLVRIRAIVPDNSGSADSSSSTLWSMIMCVCVCVFIPSVLGTSLHPSVQEVGTPAVHQPGAR